MWGSFNGGAYSKRHTTYVEFSDHPGPHVWIVCTCYEGTTVTHAVAPTLIDARILMARIVGKTRDWREIRQVPILKA